ncbi:MAG: hypothetical protein JXN59_06665 [Anaerolineae bacterium]|nr:hypothetical protein [Anaerolineae bacterium]
MPALLQVLIPYIVGGTLLLASGLFLLSLWYFRRGKQEPYWRLRRDASRTGWRLFLASLIMFGGTLAGGIVTGVTSWLLAEETAVFLATETPPPSVTLTATLLASLPTQTARVRAATSTPSHTATPVPTQTSATADSTALPTITAAPSLTATDTPLPTATLTPTRRPTRTPLPPTATLPAITPLESGIRLPAESVQVVITGIAAGVDSEFDLLDPGAVLGAGLNRIYFGMAYDGLADGAAWERALYRGEALVQGGAYLWRGGEQGEAVHFFGDAAGFPSGEYVIRISLAGDLVAEASFSLQ